MICSFCRAERRRIVKGPPGIAICELCTGETDTAPAKIESALMCSFCGLGERRSRFSFRDRKIVRFVGDVSICSQCLKTARSVLKHQLADSA